MKKNELSPECQGSAPFSGGQCYDFNKCIISSIPNSRLTSDNYKNANQPEPGTNGRKAEKLIGCQKGYLPTHKGQGKTSGMLNIFNTVQGYQCKFSVTCRCSQKRGCFWQPSTKQFDCIKVGACKNVKSLSCSAVPDSFPRYRLGNDTVAIAFSLRNEFRSLQSL